MNPVELLQELEIAAHSTENYLAPDQYYALQNMSYCRTIEKGGRITHCPACKTNTILYNPCNQRGCPQCYKKNQIQWSNKLKSKLLPIGHYHLVFSLPQHLTYIWLMDKANFINSFFHSVQQAFKQLRKETGLILGITMAFQSHGQGLCYKPHIHCIVTNHGINEKKEWVACGAISYNLLRDTVKELLIPHLNKKLDPIKKGIAETPFALCDDREWTVFPSIHKYNADKIVNYLSKS
ncbi:MAG: transposase zinc-binding domain-containing protein, partial [Candidatus Heimdallarchaeota archaeon]|nr:transposase zinc-binding domain-containing protein [Candidatus Heimdallarchaeota archaeon]